MNKKSAEFIGNFDVFPLKEEKRGIRRFFDRVTQLFKVEPSHQVTLIGRINELRDGTQYAVAQLYVLKESLVDQIDPHLYSVVLSILDPMIKDGAHLEQQIADKEEQTPHQVKIFQRYVEWLEKAKIWIELGGAPYDHDLLHQVVIAHVVQEFHQRIDRDVRVVQEYLYHFMEDLSVDQATKMLWQRQLEREILDHLSDLKKLKELKECPETLSISSLGLWRASSDHVRERCFSAALHAIDSFIHELEPSTATPSEIEAEETQKANEIAQQLGSIENKLEQLVQSMNIGNLQDDKEVKSFLTTINSLEEEVHRLNSDLSFPEEECFRLEQAEAALLQLRERLAG